MPDPQFGENLGTGRDGDVRGRLSRATEGDQDAAREQGRAGEEAQVHGASDEGCRALNSTRR